tara:strand:- start:3603 stop:3860 length:258 start_codon:yes stop_codon:yes gene_type:complete
MSKLLKRKLYVQAISFCGEFKVRLQETELTSCSLMTAITLNTIEVEFEAPTETQEDFKRMKGEQLAAVKAKIMHDAKIQCDALGE